MAFARWLDGERVELAGVDVDVLLRFLTACREAILPGRAGGNVYSIRDGRNSGYAPATINRRLAAISALFAFREMRDPSARNPVPRGRAARTTSRGERGGLLGHVAKPQARSRLRLREPRRLPRGLTREESAALLGSFRTWRDRGAGPPAPAPSRYSLSVVPWGCRDAGTSDSKMACDLAGDALGVLGPSCEVFGVGQ